MDFNPNDFSGNYLILCVFNSYQLWFYIGINGLDDTNFMDASNAQIKNVFDNNA